MNQMQNLRVNADYSLFPFAEHFCIREVGNVIEVIVFFMVKNAVFTRNADTRNQVSTIPGVQSPRQIYRPSIENIVMNVKQTICQPDDRQSRDPPSRSRRDQFTNFAGSLIGTG